MYRVNGGSAIYGKARLHGRNYYILYEGETSWLGYSVKLCTLAGDQELWAKCVPPGRKPNCTDGEGDTAVVVKRYTPPRPTWRQPAPQQLTLAKLQQWVAARQTSQPAEGFAEPRISCDHEEFWQEHGPGSDF